MTEDEIASVFDSILQREKTQRDSASFEWGKDDAGQVPSLTVREGRSDISNDRRLVEIHGKDLLYCAAWRSWLCWDGRRFIQNTGGPVMELAESVSDDL